MAAGPEVASMPVNPTIELSRQFSYDALASFLVLDTQSLRPDPPCVETATASSKDAADVAVVARMRLLEFLTAGGRPVSA
jgi:phosphodiesterase/alkaline phosphatase D-like protein